MPPVDPKRVAVEGVGAEPLELATAGFIDVVSGAVGAIGTVTTSPPVATVTAAASVSVALPAVTVSAPVASAGSASATVGSGARASYQRRIVRPASVVGQLSSVYVTAPQAIATGGASAALRGRLPIIDLSPPRDPARLARIEDRHAWRESWRRAG